MAHSHPSVAMPSRTSHAHGHNAVRVCKCGVGCRSKAHPKLLFYYFGYISTPNQIAKSMNL